MTDLLDTAKTLAGHGIAVIPIRGDGTKAPALRAWQNHETTLADIDQWFGGPNAHSGLGIVCGTRSGNLEMLEIEGPYANELTNLADLATNSNLGDLWTRLNTGWVEQSPSGGIHWFYRLETQPAGNTKLAQNENRATMVETRGQGGQVVAAPSAGTTHETGKPWVRLTGGPETIPTFTPDEHEAIHTLFATLDRRPAPPAPITSSTGTLAAASNTHTGTTPGDDFEAKTTWAQILEPAGWTIAFQQGQTTYWTRPGKTFGVSASTGRAHDRDRLYVFSSNAAPFPDQEPITKFHAHTLLHHNGDSSAAARDLRKQGFGEPSRPALPAKKTKTTPTVATVTDPIPVAVGNVIPLPAPTPAGPLGLTDDSNALAFVNDHEHTVRYNSDRGRWYSWDGHKWAPQPTTGGLAREHAKTTARNLAENGPDGADKTLRHKRYSLSDRGLNAMLSTARTDPRITVTTNDLDAHPWELNTPEGIVNLKTGELTPPNPDKLHTRSTSCTPSTSADRTAWTNFLEQTLPDPEIRNYVQRLIGYSAVGEVRDHVLPFAFGSGGNGKGVLLETVQKVLGTYATVAPAGFLMDKTNEQHPTELADLQGRRFVLASEVKDRARFDEAKVKALTGGDTVKARYMKQDFFQFTPTHHLWLMGNDKPGVDSGGDSFWRRLRLIPFLNKVPDDKKIVGLQETLANEHGPAVLQWIVDGAVAYWLFGLNEPDAIKAEVEEYKESTDVVGRFLNETCSYGPSFATHATKVTSLRAAFETWCRGEGITPMHGRRFTAQLARHGVVTGRDAPKGTGGARMYGAVLLATPPTPADTAPNWFD